MKHPFSLPLQAGCIIKLLGLAGGVDFSSCKTWKVDVTHTRTVRMCTLRSSGDSFSVCNENKSDPSALGV